MKREKKSDNLLIRCESADKTLIRWAATHLKLEKSEVIRQGIRIGVPLLVQRMKRLTPDDPEALRIRRAFKRPLKMSEILEATEEAH